MRDLMRFFTFRTAAFVLRPLLYAAGVAATAAGVYCMIKKRGELERRTDPAETSVPKDSLEHTSALLDPASGWDVEEVNVTPTDSSEPEVTLSEAEEKYKQALESTAQLENKMSKLKFQEQELEKALSEEIKNINMKKMHCACTEGAAEMMSFIVELEEKMLKFQIELLTASLDEKYEKCNRLEMMISQVECTNYELEDDFHTLEKAVEELKQQIIEADREHRSISKKNNQKHLEWKNLDSKRMQWNKTELQDFKTKCHDLLAMKRRHKKAMEQLEVSLKDADKSKEQMENEKSALIYKVHQLTGRVQQLEEILYDVNLTQAAIKKDCEQAWQAYTILKSEYEETFKQPPTEVEKEQEDPSILETSCNKDSLTEAKNKWADMSRSISALKERKTPTMDKIDYMERVNENLLEDLYKLCNKTAVALWRQDRILNTYKARKTFQHTNQGE